MSKKKRERLKEPPSIDAPSGGLFKRIYGFIRSHFSTLALGIIGSALVAIFISPHFNRFPRETLRSDIDQAIGSAIQEPERRLMESIERSFRPLLKKYEDLIFELTRDPKAVFEAKKAFEEGVKAFRNKQFEAAAEAFDRSVRIIRSYAGYLNLARTYERLYRYASAVEAYQRALELKVDDPDLYSDLAWAYLYSDEPLKALTHHQQALRLANKYRLREKVPMILFDIGLTYYADGNLEEAKTHLSRAYDAFKDIEDLVGAAVALEKTGVVLIELGQVSSGVESLKNAILILESKEKHELAAKARNNLIAYFLRSFQLDDAQSLLLKNEKEFLKLGNKFELFNTWNNMGNLLLLRNSLDEAKVYYEKALNGYRAINKSLGEGEALNNLGIIYFHRGDLKTALRYFLDAYKIHDSAGYRKMTITKLINIGMLYDEIGDNVKAEEYLTKAIRLSDETGSRYLYAKALFGMGLVKAPKNWREALNLLTKANQIFQKMSASRDFDASSKMIDDLRPLERRSLYLRVTLFAAAGLLCLRMGIYLFEKLRKYKKY